MTKFQVFQAAVLAVILLFVFLVVEGWHEAQSDPIVRRVTIAMRGVPAGTRPLRVVLISDIHVGNHAMSAARFDRIIAQVNAQHPDTVWIAGDLVNGLGVKSSDFHPEMLSLPLSRLRAPLGVFAVLGNHDDDTSPAQVDAALHKAGITVLHDQVVRVGPIALIGENIRLPLSPPIPALVKQARKLGGMRVLMLHPPPYWGAISHEIPVILAGHSHCGQIVFPGFDNSYDYFHGNWRYPPKTRCGMVRFDKHLEIITGGVGAATVVPLRINAPPDFWVITFVGQP
ncbi:metallophosphoesterase [Novosphingobium sp.]|uniref:metallophosphoesterase n=1 Tax=Novosphingobium sp. TaxID=1874826 RepID=UPI003B51F640